MFDTHENTDIVINIPINDIKPNPYKTRKFYDVTSVSELADSIKEIGLLQPVSVRKIRHGSYELISGERRLRAAEIAGFLEIPAIVRSVSDNMSAMLTLAENIQRKDINFFETAAACYHMVFDHDIPKEELAKSLGITETAISKMLNLSRLSSTIKNIILENNLTQEHAMSLLKISDESIRLDALKHAIEYSMSPTMLDKYIENALTEKPAIPQKAVKCRGVKDYKIIFNTIRQAVKLVEGTGVRTRTKKIERDNYFEYVIRISK